MAWTKNAAIVVGVFMLGTGAITALAPQTPAQYEQNRQEQQVNDLVDSQERVEESRREQAKALGEADQADRAIPGEHRPPEGHTPKVRIRLP